MALHPAIMVAFFWRMMTLLTRVLLEIHCISYIIFCHPEDSAAAFWTICVTKSQLSRILPVLSALQKLLLLRTAMLWSLKNMQARYCSCATGSCTDKLDVCGL